MLTGSLSAKNTSLTVTELGLGDQLQSQAAASEEERRKKAMQMTNGQGQYGLAAQMLFPNTFTM